MKKCKICKIKFDNSKHSDINICDNSECLEKYAISYLLKQKKEKRKIMQIENKKTIERLRTKSEWLNMLQREINKIALLIDKGQPCISSNLTKCKMNAGHYYNIKEYNYLRFNLHNIHVQSIYANKWKSGDLINYRNGLIVTYGDEYMQKINDLLKLPKTIFTLEWIKDKIILAKYIIKELESNNESYNNMQRIGLRNYCNNMLK